ncbi:DUF6527 family protein [Variovorax paradoxus]|uniref:DUF6527 family protein n=1 Tax=Variovorax paradoxus TaxID=34073 RepID=UPI00285E6DD5|nr:DUF6527 family protein [Variovorax paradoxus]MDR6453439.1 hypothetical protein [Variovorax paradoxus]
MFAWLKQRVAGWLDKFDAGRKLVVVKGDSLPSPMPHRDVVLARDDGEDWCVGLRCPCGCGRVIELLVVPEASPRWNITTDSAGRPTLHPSIWLKDGCRSHFWLRNGKVQWCT